MKQIVLSKGKNRNKITSAGNRKAGLISELLKTTSVVYEGEDVTQECPWIVNRRGKAEKTVHLLQSSANLKLV